MPGQHTLPGPFQRGSIQLTLNFYVNLFKIGFTAFIKQGMKQHALLHRRQGIDILQCAVRVLIAQMFDQRLKVLVRHGKQGEITG